MVAKSVLREKLRLYFETSGGDVEHAHELYHDNAVLEFPQSGERFEGVDTFTEWRAQYPAGQIDFTVVRTTAREDVAVIELTASYDGGPTMYGVALWEFRDDKIARERIYVAEGWEAPEWRAPWRSETSANAPE
jgi:ketosteroid isomerase-like protein